MQDCIIFTRLFLTRGTVLRDSEVSARFRVKRSCDERAGRVHLNSDLMNSATTDMHSERRSRSIHFKLDNLTSNGIGRMRKDILLRTCADGFRFSRYAYQSTSAP